MKTKISKWNEKIIYQIFPRSFYDSNNDGNGDLKGIINKLKYLKLLGINAIWLCPIYETDFVDAGYDVSNYKEVWKKFGTINDFKELVKEAKKYDIDIIMDIVLNHTSTNHVWFKKAIESENNPEHNYYIWTKNPKNEESIFGGSAWEYVPNLNKYYFHLFSKEQADLNWESNETISAMVDVVNYWYNLGVKGFRLDAIQHVHKELKDEQFSHSFSSKMVAFLQKFLNQVKKDKDDIFFIAEASGITPEKVLKYSKDEEKIADNFFNFSTWYVGWGKQTGRNGYDPNWTVDNLVNDNFIEYQNNDKIENLMITNFLSSHDTSRAISRWGNENLFWKESAKSLALFQFMQKGLQCILYGEEIGMLNSVFKTRDDFRDIDVYNSYQLFVDKNKVYTEEEMTRFHNINSRDHSRLPMIWNNKTNYGFNDGFKPWIQFGKYFKNASVEEQIEDQNSIFYFYKNLIEARNKYKNILVYGKSFFEFEKDKKLIKITRQDKDNNYIISLINLTPREIEINDQDLGEILLTTYTDKKEFKNILRPYESIMFLR
ncbi:OLIGO-1,6-GLUCOSIDASE (SUCRASE-ISOMALTASE) (LIMIT DEXTRINASE)(ISOMALTASE) (DEXTRIN 6-ALPHA-D-GLUCANOHYDROLASE) [Mycoplasmopsis pulmonis]|uniref:OLIGO-1,6-GLUCOSIDASE (SUCRASE-ISOMALTASE) (LIMIT DEXTRINASE)(ISOMALTASE) (DEXTRIN 6-ALPHA-D-GLUCANOHYDROLASE) n=1 Tax=Mycoplasmopsis pulmonis (strain UAB CTIP) TaxID=272635 RepID=Q98PT6_MYCPU|nr:alpha-amylase family glycosyl hydrolase [Mycoplasmopsis pulmonis]CAC13806.1 OLIGO-1,6-GLUCOSIDASE (SUCRASE-ISOMALTASE) (LIMIT DEXTRINASE)(ISOMALTASE) (DEXTRIN 6-ALPHA-D-GLUCANOHYDROLASE) [Mycoplasmopsis pulmonis]VEU68395.1 Oligo-1,6-glucosidase [Mycoplasmopsis pulmonis]